MTTKRRAMLAACLVSLGCGAPVASPERLRLQPVHSRLPRLVSETLARSGRVGVEDVAPLVDGVMAEGEQVGRFVTIPEGRCVAALARGGASVRDIDLFVFDESGDLLAVDEAPVADAATMVCPPRPRRVYVAVRVVGGSGLVGAVVLSVAPERADILSRDLGARGRRGEDTGKLDDWPGLESKLRSRREALGGNWEDVRRVELPLDPHASTLVTLKVEPRRCLDVFALGSAEVPSFSLELHDGAGRVVSRGRLAASEQAVTVCAQDEVEITAALRPRAAIGTAALVAARSTRGAFAELAGGVELILTGALFPIERALALHHDRTSQLSLKPPTRVAEGTVSPGVAARHEVELPAGCSRLDVIGGAPLGAIRAELWSQAPRLLERSLGAASAALLWCQDAPGRVDVEVSSEGEPGPFVIEARSGPDEFSIAKRARAGGRLFQRLEDFEGPVDTNVFKGVQPFSTSASGSVELDVPLTAGCTTWFAAVDEGVPIVVEVLRAGGATRTIARGSGVATLEACTDEPARTRIRIRSDGPAEGLLLSRR